MTTAITLAFLHHAAAFVLVAVLTVELVLTKGELTAVSARSVVRMDATYGVSAAALLIVGLLRVFYTEKGAAYYFHSAPFLVKLSLFIAVGLLSTYPTREFFGWRKALKTGGVPVLAADKRRSIRLILHVELTLLFIIMLCAAMMARGVGYFG